MYWKDLKLLFAQNFQKEKSYDLDIVIVLLTTTKRYLKK